MIVWRAIRGTIIGLPNTLCLARIPQNKAQPFSPPAAWFAAILVYEIASMGPVTSSHIYDILIPVNIQALFQSNKVFPIPISSLFALYIIYFKNTIKDFEMPFYEPRPFRLRLTNQDRFIQPQYQTTNPWRCYNQRKCSENR
jgi:hypothetical protein